MTNDSSIISYGKAPEELDFPTGSFLHDVRYCKRTSTNPETYEVVYFDTMTDRLEVRYIDPIIDIWFLKDEYRTNTYESNGKTYHYQLPHVEMDKCFRVWCKPSQIPKMIAKYAGDIPLPEDLEMDMTFGEFYEANKDQFIKSTMCRNPYVFKADFTEDVYFRLRWLQKYSDECDVSKVTFGFMDIEVDVLDRLVDMQDIESYGKQPINAITVILPKQKICAVLMLSPRPDVKLAPKFHSLLQNQKVEYQWVYEHQEEFKRMIVEDDEDNKVYLKDYEIRLHFFDYYKEIHMIQTAYAYFNRYRPMFAFAWNAPFDFNYLPARIEYLGYDKAEVMLSPEFKTRVIRFQPDNSKQYSMKTSRDWFYVSSYTTWVCEMRLFAAIRKSQQERRSYTLSSIGKDIAKIDKLSDSKSDSFRNFAYTDYIKFILYNVRDVVVQDAIETNVNDSQTLFSRSYMFATSYSKCFQETHIVRNIREYIFEDEHIVQACRLYVDPKVDKAFKGAFVAEPSLNAPTGLILNGIPFNNILYGVMDADASAYYPTMKMLLNLDTVSFIGKCKINNDVFRNKLCINRSFNQEYTWYDSKNKPHEEDMAGPLLNTYRNHNECTLMWNWLGLPSITNYIKQIESMI